MNRTERTVTIFAFGSAGDTRPIVALGAGLRERGIGVRVLAAARYAGLVEGAGLRHEVLAVDPMEIIGSEEGRAWLSSRNPLSMLRGFRDVVRPLAERVLDQSLSAARGSDLVLAPATGFIGYHVAQRLAIPTALLHLQPGEPTRTAANPLVAGGRSLGGPLNRASYELVEQVSWLLSRSLINPWRRRAGLPEIPPSGPFRAARRDRVPVLAGFSPTVVPRPADWPEEVHQTGFWFLDEVDVEDPVPESVAPGLIRFLDDGPPPVYIGFGSMVPAQPEKVWPAVQEALRRNGMRGVMLGHPDGSGLVGGGWIRPDRDLLVVPSADHAWLFPRTAAVVHHGGAGTTAAGLRAGVPSVICPFFSDQPFWGRRVASLGTGPEPLPIKQLTADALTRRIQDAVHGRGIATRAKAVADDLAKEDGVGAACDLAESWIRGARSGGRFPEPAGAA
jgi:UDP:flavonoid glycosyltransferase YjiC (YdhE family)